MERHYSLCLESAAIHASWKKCHFTCAAGRGRSCPRAHHGTMSPKTNKAKRQSKNGRSMDDGDGDAMLDETIAEPRKLS